MILIRLIFDRLLNFSFPLLTFYIFFYKTEPSVFILDLRETAGDKLLIGVDRGVDLGVDPADSRPIGLVNLWLNIFSFPSGTVTYID